ncbi:hypothetical protein [Corynebacterium sp. 13CS0277]|uniref:hypothetical protein n=1 Tax=Corynebacterium sp. 13CS0277 TaxID=2071994 RepID=UPI001304CE87|nr:hypothetical protein [Corynebacterium sp. 13CS0277]
MSREQITLLSISAHLLGGIVLWALWTSELRQGLADAGLGLGLELSSELMAYALGSAYLLAGFVLITSRMEFRGGADIAVAVLYGAAVLLGLGFGVFGVFLSDAVPLEAEFRW